jgi:hypothetical protein
VSGRVAVIGDIGGHAQELRSALTGLGVDPASDLFPDDLSIVQVGDLINRGPDTPGVLGTVTRMLAMQRDRWHQIGGNHEGLYLPGGAIFDWSEVLNDVGQNLLRHWWTSGFMRPAVGLSTNEGDMLITHAGLTVGLWRKIGAPTDVRDAVALLNALPQTHPDWLWRPGMMLTHRNPSWNAGPMWAEAGNEVYASWIEAEADGETVPFGQVHGHSTAYWWPDRRWNVHPRVRDRFTPNHRARHLRGVIGSQPFIGIDPCFGRTVGGPWQPLVFTDARVIA